MVVAKGGGAEFSCDQFASREVRRRYVAILSGVPSASKGRIEAPIGRSSRSSSHGGDVRRRTRAATTKLSRLWRTEARPWSNGASRPVDAPNRVHARHIGHPILGDDTTAAAAGPPDAPRGTASSIRNAPRRCSPPSIVRCFTRARSASPIHARAGSTSAETHRTISKLPPPPPTNGERSPDESRSRDERSPRTRERAPRVSSARITTSIVYHHLRRVSRSSSVLSCASSPRRRRPRARTAFPRPSSTVPRVRTMTSIARARVVPSLRGIVAARDDGGGRVDPRALVSRPPRWVRARERRMVLGGVRWRRRERVKGRRSTANGNGNGNRKIKSKSQPSRRRCKIYSDSDPDGGTGARAMDAVVGIDVAGVFGALHRALRDRAERQEHPGGRGWGHWGKLN